MKLDWRLMDLRGGNGGGVWVASAVAVAAASTGSTGLWRPHRPIIGLYFGTLLLDLSEIANAIETHEKEEKT